MAELPTTLSETTKGLANEYIKNVVQTIVQGMGGRASDAVKLSRADELGAWMRATATPEQIAAMIEQGADDQTILQQARKYRYALGKAAAQGDPVKECEYHEKMAAEAAAYQEAVASGLPHEQALKVALGSGTPTPVDRQPALPAPAPDLEG